MVAQMEAEIDDKVLGQLFGSMSAKGVTKIVMEIKDVQGKLIIKAEPSEEEVMKGQAKGKQE